MAVGLKHFRIQIKSWGLNNYYNAQGRNQNFFRAGEVSWNQDTLINISLKKKKEKWPHWGKLGVFSPRNSYNYTLNKNINSKMDKIRASFDFQKWAGEAPLLPPLVTHLMLEGAGGNDLQFSQKQHFSIETGV